MSDQENSRAAGVEAAGPLRPILAAWRALACGLGLALLLLSGRAAMAQSSQPRTVSFQSADGKTMLTGYLFAPAGRPNTAPAVVLMHGRTGVYSSRAKGNYSSMTLNPDIRSWANLWAAHGYWALVVDSFGPRGYPSGVPTAGNATRPLPINNIADQELDAYGALRYLRANSRVRSDRIALEGWADAGSAVIDGMSDKMLSPTAHDRGRGFRAAVSLYPDCGAQGHVDENYVPYAPLRIFVGGREQKAATALVCEKLAASSKARGGDVTVTTLAAAPREAEDSARPQKGTAANTAREIRRQAESFVVGALGH